MGDEAADRRSNDQSSNTESHEMKLISTERYRIIRQASTETFELIFAEDKRTQKKNLSSNQNLANIEHTTVSSLCLTNKGK